MQSQHILTAVHHMVTFETAERLPKKLGLVAI